MNNFNPKELIEKYLNGTCTKEERLLVERYYRDESLKRELPEGEIVVDEVRSEIWNATYRSIIKNQRNKIIQNWAIAASVLVVLSVSLWLFTPNERSAPLTAKRIDTVEVKPAAQRAILTLLDGSTINLDDVSQGTLSHQDGREVVKLANGSIEYRNTNNTSISDRPVYNTLSTPRGSYYHLTLSDGSGVWLNAGSSITYPVSFSGKERKVSITGEAYFEVTRNEKMPFKVSVSSMEVQVLGTHFNIMSYDDEANVKTTLLEGAVKVNAGSQHVLLKPGQQADVSKSGSGIKVHDANREEAVSWKNGYFMFNNEDIKSVMRKISRWYDVEIEYTGKPTEKKLSGTVSRFEDISEILKVLELTGLVHFKVDGRRVVVMP